MAKGKGDTSTSQSQSPPTPPPEITTSITVNSEQSLASDVVIDSSPQGNIEDSASVIASGSAAISKPGGGLISDSASSGTQSKQEDKPGITSQKTKTGIPPKSTGAETKLPTSVSDAILTDDGIVEIKKTKPISDDIESEALPVDKKVDGNYNTSYLRYLDLALIHYGFNGQPSFVEAFTAKPSPGYSPTIKVSSNLQADTDSIVLDMIPFISVPGSTDEEKRRYGGNYSLDPSSPFQLSLPGREGIEFDAASLHQYLSYTPRKNTLKINWSQLVSRGIFDFNLKLNFIDRTTESGINSSPVGVFQVDAIDNIDYFHTLSIKVLKSGKEENHRIICSEPERHDFVPYLNVKNPGIANASANFNRVITLRLSRNLESRSLNSGNYFTRLDVNHKTNFYKDPIFTINDRSDIISIKRPITSDEGSLNFYTKTFYDGYVFDNDSMIFYDHFIERKLSHNLLKPKEGYTIFSVDDAMNILGTSSEVSSEANDIEFRREYVYSELTNEEERRDLKANYFLYINKDMARASNRLSPIIEMKLNNLVTGNVACSLGYKILSNKDKIKDNFSIKLVGLTRVGNLENPQVFAKEISLEWDSSDSFPYGKYTTYGSGSGSENDGYPLRCFCIKDLFNVLNDNLYGRIGRGTPSGGGDSDLSGLFPTIGEMYPERYSSENVNFNSPIVQFTPTKEYSGHYLMPLSRMWLGNKSGNNYEAISERNILTISNHESLDPYASPSGSRDYIYCRGLEKDISLEKFTIMSPVARKIGVPGVRTSIKTYESHLESGDFDLISEEGEGDSRFYKWNTVKDFVDILREGDQFGLITKSLDSFEVENMFGRRCQTSNYARGFKRRLIGLASIGVSTPFYDDIDTFNGDVGWSKIPSYVLSSMFVGKPENPKTLRKYFDEWGVEEYDRSLNGSKIHIAYSNYPTFDAPGRAKGQEGLSYFTYSTVHNVVDWVEDVYPHGFDWYAGGNWWITYSTFNSDGHNFEGNYKKNTQEMLDPFLFGQEYQTMFEGGEFDDSTRRVSYSHLFDFSSDNDGILPSYKHIYKMINDRLQAGVSSGEYTPGVGLRFRSGANSYYLDTNGHCNINGTGEVSYFIYFLRDQSQDPTKIKVSIFKEDSADNEYSVDLSSFDVYKEMRSLFGSSMLFESSADFDLEDKFPLWVTVFPEKPDVLQFPGPYDSLGPGPKIMAANIPLDSTPGIFDPYAISVDDNGLVILDPTSSPEAVDGSDSIDPYQVVTPEAGGLMDISVITGEPIYTQEITLNLGESADILYRKQSFNTSLFEFYINDNKHKTIHDLSDSMNKELSHRGIRFTNLLDFSRFYSPQELMSLDDEVNILELSQLNTNRHGLTLYGGSKSESIDLKGEYASYTTSSDNTFSLNINFRRNDSVSSVTPIVKENLLSTKTNDDLPSNLRRNRFRSDVQELLTSYVSRRSDQISQIVHESKSRSDLIINVGQYEIGAKESGVGSQHGDYRIAGGEDAVGLQVSLGGFVKNGDFIVFNAPNSYFESNYNVFFPLEFSVKETEVVILLIRVRNEDGSYAPDSGDDYSSFRASISYSNGVMTEHITGVTQSQVPGANYVEFEELQDETIDEVSPVVLMIPIKSSVNNVLVRNDFYNLETSIKIVNSIESLDEFGFLAINRNNFNFNMQESKVSNTFGLVLDYLGAWDIMIAPEAMINRQPNGVFNYLGLGYNRQFLDTDEAFIGGVGVSVPDPDNVDPSVFDQSLNDIFIDNSVLPDDSRIRDGVRLLQVPSYPKVFVLQIDPSVKNYLSEIRSSDPNSQEGCFIDIPLFFKGKTTGAEGACFVRVFHDTSCVFDHSLCDFFWNLSDPPELAGPEIIENKLEVITSGYADCTDESYRDEYNNIIFNQYVDVRVSGVPMLDSGNALLLIKSPKSMLNVRSVFKPSQEVLNRILYIVPEGDVPPETPWELDCDNLSQDELGLMNKPVIYTDPNDKSVYSNNLSDIMSTLESGDNYMFVHPQFFFPERDLLGSCYSDEQIIMGIGMSFKNWRVGSDSGFEFRGVLGVETMLPSNIITEFSIPFCVKYMYSEDRKVR